MSSSTSRPRVLPSSQRRTTSTTSPSQNRAMPRGTQRGIPVRVDVVVVTGVAGSAGFRRGTASGRPVVSHHRGSVDARRPPSPEPRGRPPATTAALSMGHDRGVEALRATLADAIRAQVAGDGASDHARELFRADGERWYRRGDPVWVVHADVRS